MTEAVQIALIGGVPLTVTAIAGLVVSIANGRKAAKLLVKTDEIHTLTNSHLTRVTNQLETARREIEQMRDVIHNFIEGNKTKLKKP